MISLTELHAASNAALGAAVAATREALEFRGSDDPDGAVLAQVGELLAASDSAAAAGRRLSEWLDDADPSEAIVLASLAAGAEVAAGEARMAVARSVARRELGALEVPAGVPRSWDTDASK